MIDTKSLKPGDEVATHRYNYGNRRYQLHKVTKVSPTGQITIDNGARFNTSGWLIGDTGSWDRFSIVAVTDEIRETATRTALVEEVGRFNGKWATLPTDALRRIAGIIDEHTGTTGEVTHAD